MSYRSMKAADLVTVAITPDMVGKIYLLACATQGIPNNDSCDCLAVNLLDSALDAALDAYEDHDGCIDLLSEGSIRFEVAQERIRPTGGTGINGFYLKVETEKVLLACCKAADVDPHDFVESWIGGLVESSMEGDIATEGITADLLAKYGHQGESDPDAYTSLHGRLKRIISRARGRKERAR